MEKENAQNLSKVATENSKKSFKNPPFLFSHVKLFRIKQRHNIFVAE